MIQKGDQKCHRASTLPYSLCLHFVQSVGMVSKIKGIKMVENMLAIRSSLEGLLVPELPENAGVGFGSILHGEHSLM